MALDSLSIAQQGIQGDSALIALQGLLDEGVTPPVTAFDHHGGGYPPKKRKKPRFVEPTHRLEYAKQLRRDVERAYGIPDDAPIAVVEAAATIIEAVDDDTAQPVVDLAMLAGLNETVKAIRDARRVLLEYELAMLADEEDIEVLLLH